MHLKNQTDVCLHPTPYTSVLVPPSGSSALAKATAEWFFVAANDIPPAARVAALLCHAAKMHPHKPVPLKTIAVIVFGLDAEPGRTSPYVAAVRAAYRCVDRRLKLDGRRLLRLGASVRASVNEADAHEVLAPRAVARARGYCRSFFKVVRRCETLMLADPASVQVAANLDEDLLSAADRAYRRAFLAAAGMKVDMPST